jgi:hypothetical protein
MEKPNARGPSPGRKAVSALGARLNRKPKRPPPLPLKKKIRTRSARLTARPEQMHNDLPALAAKIGRDFQ